MLNSARLKTGFNLTTKQLLLKHQGTNFRHRNCLPVAYFSSGFDSMYKMMINLPAVHYMEDTMAQFHDYTGLPWFGSIILFTAGLRTMISLPAQVTSHKVAAKRTLMFEEINKALPALKEATAKHVRLKGLPAGEAAARYKRVAQTIHSVRVIEYNCHMSKLFLPLYIQIPVWLFNSIALRNLSLMRASPERLASSPVEERFLQLGTEGALWFPSLTSPDPFFILPVIVGATFATNIFLTSIRNRPPETVINVTKYEKRMSIFLYGIAVLMVPLSAIQPSALPLYWATSGAIGIVHNLIVISPKFKKIVKIPQLPVDSITPYQDIRRKISILLDRK